MAKRILTTSPTGALQITHIIGPDLDNRKLAQTLFELSRTTDMLTPFDPAQHTLDSIVRGIPGHYPIPYREVDESELPAENALRGKEETFRDAWEDTGRTVEVNMPKARDIHMNRIRSARNLALAAQDVALFKAIEGGDVAEQAKIAALKQTLRDIPQTFRLDGAQTPEALKALWPSELPKG